MEGRWPDWNPFFPSCELEITKGKEDAAVFGRERLNRLVVQAHPEGARVGPRDQGDAFPTGHGSIHRRRHLNRVIDACDGDEKPAIIRGRQRLSGKRPGRGSGLVGAASRCLFVDPVSDPVHRLDHPWSVIAQKFLAEAAAR
jgi:hypothetical protein